MRLPQLLALAVAAVGLAACVSAAPVQLPDDHPASPKATAGLVDAPTAIADYKGADDFAARAADTTSPGHHGTMPEMPGMQHGGAPQGAGSR